MTDVVVIVADDMRYDHLEFMPAVRRLIQDRGRTFTQARCNVALCQPCRVGFMTGQLSRHHGDLSVGFAGSTMTAEDNHNTVAAWIAERGYRCGLFGKYINGIDVYGGLPAPRGWARWRQFNEGEVSQESFQVRAEPDRTIQVDGQYQTEYLSQEASSFLLESPEPTFAYLAPRHPHAPFSPHPDDLHAWSHVRCREIPLDDVSTKPRWIEESKPLTPNQWAQVQADFRNRLRELSAVDRMVEHLLTSMEEAGRLDDTVVVFTSDNGVHQGEQRRPGDGTKGGPYDVGLRVPLLVAGPGFEPGPDITVPVYNSVDITATVVDVAGASPGRPNQAGVSLRAIAADPAAYSQRTLVHEVAAFLVSGDGVTTGPDHALGHRKLFRFPSRREGGDPLGYEMYDLATDPDELVNLADDPAQRPLRDALEGLLDQHLA